MSTTPLLSAESAESNRAAVSVNTSLDGLFSSSVPLGAQSTTSSRLQSEEQVVQIIDTLENTVEMLKHTVRPIMPNARKRILGRRFTNTLLPLAIVWQVLNVIILTLIDKNISNEEIARHPLDNKYFFAGVVVMVVFQMIHMVVVVIASVKLAKQVLHRTATSSFLVQSYLSTVLLFAGVYTLLFRADKSAWKGIMEDKNDEASVQSNTYIAQAFAIMLYYSVTTMTGTGFGDIHPVSWYLYLIVTAQMLLAVVYTTTIFARGLTILGGAKFRLAGEGGSATAATRSARSASMPPTII
eukprot:m.113157 g.113157  ORF g.113157 m.113157 type:complete len:298 (+) comp19304_c0_seq3:55-948(+)